jgi:hypothetical protein
MRALRRSEGVSPNGGALRARVCAAPRCASLASGSRSSRRRSDARSTRSSAPRRPGGQANEWREACVLARAAVEAAEAEGAGRRKRWRSARPSPDEGGPGAWPWIRGPAPSCWAGGVISLVASVGTTTHDRAEEAPGGSRLRQRPRHGRQRALRRGRRDLISADLGAPVLSGGGCAPPVVPARQRTPLTPITPIHGTFAARPPGAGRRWSMRS